MSQPLPERSPDQIARERAMGFVSDVLFNLDGAIERAEKGRKQVAKDGSEPNVEIALSAAVQELKKVRKRLFQETYFGNDAVRMF